MKKITVVKSNKVIEASYKLTLNEQRLILACISQIKRGVAIDSNSEFEIKAVAFAELFGISDSVAYRDLRSAGASLLERLIIIKSSSEKKGELHTRWISSIEYIEGDGSIKLCFAQKILPYISKLESEFTQYSIESISKMKHTHSVRIYEILMQWKHVGKRQIDLSDLRRMLCLEDKYPRIKDFKAKVLHPALKEINDLTDLDVTYEQYKEGRTVKGFTFIFTLKQVVIPKITKAYIEEHARAGETYQQAEERLRKNLELLTKK